MKDMEVLTDDELESQNFSGKKSDRKPSGDDPISDYLLKVYYSFSQSNPQVFCIIASLSPFMLIYLFSLLISSSAANTIAFTALVISVVFILISIWMLCWILDKDPGDRAMQDISDPIKEGSEGFFITQYGTIFKLAFAFSFFLFLLYLYRPPVSDSSPLHNYISGPFMALITSISFLIGANCSALSGYAGIWVSVRANVRVASASRKCYNDSL